MEVISDRYVSLDYDFEFYFIFSPTWPVDLFRFLKSKRMFPDQENIFHFLWTRFPIHFKRSVFSFIESFLKLLELKSQTSENFLFSKVKIFRNKFGLLFSDRALRYFCFFTFFFSPCSLSDIFYILEIIFGRNKVLDFPGRLCWFKKMGSLLLE